MAGAFVCKPGWLPLEGPPLVTVPLSFLTLIITWYWTLKGTSDVVRGSFAVSVDLVMVWIHSGAALRVLQSYRLGQLTGDCQWRRDGGNDSKESEWGGELWLVWRLKKGQKFHKAIWIRNCVNLAERSLHYNILGLSWEKKSWNRGKKEQKNI